MKSTCAKTCHASASAAMKEMKRQRLRNGCVYLCRYCHAYHISGQRHKTPHDALVGFKRQKTKLAEFNWRLQA